MLTIFGAIFKILHYPFGQTLMIVGTICSLGFIIPALIDVFNNEKNKFIEKFAWLICFIFLSWIAGLIYYKTYSRRNN